MFGDDHRLITCGDGGEPAEVHAVERAWRADRQAHAVQKERITFANRFEPPVRRSAGAHVVLRMHFEEAECGTALDHRVEMLGLEADADACRSHSMRTNLCHATLPCGRFTPMSSRSIGGVLQGIAASFHDNKCSWTCNDGQNGT